MSPSTARFEALEAEVHETRTLLQEHIKATAGLAEGLADNTATTQRIEAAMEANRVTAELAVKSVVESNAAMLDFFTSVKGAFKVFDMLGKLARPLGYILAAVAGAVSLWYTIRGHR